MGRPPPSPRAPFMLSTEGLSGTSSWVTPPLLTQAWPPTSAEISRNAVLTISR